MLEPFQVFLVGWFLFVVALCAIGFIALIVGAIWMYRDAESRRMEAGLWVLLLILATLLGAGIIGFAVVFLIYLVVRESHPIGWAIPYAYTPGGYPPSQPPVAQTAPVPAPCPVCGRPMMWYPQYQRWYCPTCAQYR